MKIDKIFPAGGNLQHVRADRAISSGAKRRRAPVAGATPLSIVLWLRGRYRRIEGEGCTLQ